MILRLTHTSEIMKKEYDDFERKWIQRIMEDTEGKMQERKSFKGMAKSRMTSSVAPSKKKSLQKITQNTLIKTDGIGFFKITDVAGDGNCFLMHWFSVSI